MRRPFFLQAQKDLRMRASWRTIKEKVAKIPRLIPRAWGLAKRLRYRRKQT